VLSAVLPRGGGACSWLAFPLGTLLSLWCSPGSSRWKACSGSSAPAQHREMGAEGFLTASSSRWRSAS
jgi:hypothetical protein